MKRTEELVKQDYYIPGLKQKVEKIITNCVKCILGNRKQGKQEGFLHPLTKDSVPLHTLHVDHQILAVIDGFKVYLVVSNQVNGSKGSDSEAARSKDHFWESFFDYFR